MADAIDIAAKQFVQRNPEVFGNTLLNIALDIGKYKRR